MKILKVTWSTNNECTIGFVLFENDYGEKQLRMAKVPGFDSKLDIKYVIDWGSLVPVYDLKNMIDLLEEKT